MFVATIKRIPIGVSHLSIDKPYEVWLSGARTDPKHRWIGVATAITRKYLKYAKKKGAKIGRLGTESNNKAAQAVLQKLGFKPIAELSEMITENIRKEKSKKSKLAEKDQTEAIWTYLQSSKTYDRAAGLYTVLYHWFSLEKEDLERFVCEQKAIVHKNEKGEVNGLTLIDDATAQEWRENTMQTCYINGDYSAVLDMIKFLRNHCHGLSIKRIYGFTCNHKPITKALEKLGFRPPDSVEIIYETRLVEA